MQYNLEEIQANYEQAKNNVAELTQQMEVAHASLALYSHSQQWQRHVQAKQSELKFWTDYVHSLEQQQQQGLAMSWQDEFWDTEQSTVTQGENPEENGQIWNWGNEQWEDQEAHDQNLRQEIEEGF